MKLLLDENLSPRLIRLLADVYPGSAHVRDVKLQSALPGCRVVVHDSALPDWKPAAQADTIMLYVKHKPTGAPPP